MQTVDTRVAAVTLGVALLLIFGGSALAFWGQTAGGAVDVHEIAIETDNGTINGYLYVPDEASAQDPHPGILAVHGYTSTKETQSSSAIEYAKRGHVVLAIDQPGHETSEPPAYAGGFGGPAAVEYLADREEVDEENIGLEGHSMGGWSVAIAAAEDGIVLWALVNTLLIAGLFGIWQYRRDRSLAELRTNYGLDTGSGGRSLWLSFAVAAGVVATVYTLLWVVHTLFMTDFRIWVVAIRPMSSHHVGIFLRYLLPLTAFFVVLGVLLHGQLRTPARSLRRSLGINIGLLSGPFVVLLAIMYLPMLTSGALLIPLTALQAIIAIQFVVILAVAGAVSTYCFHLTGRIWVGSLLNGLFVTWVIVASQATHVTL